MSKPRVTSACGLHETAQSVVMWFLQGVVKDAEVNSVAGEDTMIWRQDAKMELGG